MGSTEDTVSYGAAGAKTNQAADQPRAPLARIRPADELHATVHPDLKRDVIEAIDDGSVDYSFVKTLKRIYAAKRRMIGNVRTTTQGSSTCATPKTAKYSRRGSSRRRTAGNSPPHAQYAARHLVLGMGFLGGVCCSALELPLKSSRQPSGSARTQCQRHCRLLPIGDFDATWVEDPAKMFWKTASVSSRDLTEKVCRTVKYAS